MSFAGAFECIAVLKVSRSTGKGSEDSTSKWYVKFMQRHRKEAIQAVGGSNNIQRDASA
jgi:hypothetical protein